MNRGPGTGPKCICMYAMKTKCYQFNNFVVTGGTVSCREDNLRCHQWLQICQIDDLLFLVYIHTHTHTNTHFSVLRISLECFSPNKSRKTSIEVVVQGAISCYISHDISRVYGTGYIKTHGNQGAVSKWRYRMTPVKEFPLQKCDCPMTILSL